MKTSRTSSTVTKALQVLRAMANYPNGIRLSEIVRNLRLSNSTTHMLLSTLVAQGFAERLESGLYRLGMGAFEVGSAVPDSARFGTLTGPMKELADVSGEAVSLAVKHGQDAVMIQRFESRQILRAEIRVGTRMPLHSCASGKFLLAHMADDELNDVYPNDELSPSTSYSIRSKTLLKKEFPEIIKKGYAVNKKEYTDGIDGIATGVRGRSNRFVAALSIAGPTNRFVSKDWVMPLIETAAAMTTMLHD